MTLLPPCASHSASTTCEQDIRCEWREKTCTRHSSNAINTARDPCLEWKEHAPCELADKCKWFAPTGQCLSERSFAEYNRELTSKYSDGHRQDSRKVQGPMQGQSAMRSSNREAST